MSTATRQVSWLALSTPLSTCPSHPLRATGPLTFRPTPQALLRAGLGPGRARWPPVPTLGFMDDPATLWLFRENHACVKRTIMAQKTEDPAVFTVDCKCSHAMPVEPPSSQHPQAALDKQ